MHNSFTVLGEGWPPKIAVAIHWNATERIISQFVIFVNILQMIFYNKTVKNK